MGGMLVAPTLLGRPSEISSKIPQGLCPILEAGYKSPAVILGGNTIRIHVIICHPHGSHGGHISGYHLVTDIVTSRTLKPHQIARECALPVLNTHKEGVYGCRWAITVVLIVNEADLPAEIRGNHTSQMKRFGL